MYKNTSLGELIQINKDFINSEVDKKVNIETIKKIVKTLNAEKKVIISGMDFIWKLDTIKSILIKSNSLENTVYFNKRLDSENIIKNWDKLSEYINKSINKNTKIIVLQNIWEIENIKDFLKDLFKTNYKIIIIWNDIKVSFIKDIEIKQMLKWDISKELYYWNISILSNSTNSNLNKLSLSIKKDKIILDNIFNLKAVKNINLYNSTISFLSKIDDFISIREIHEDFIKNENIAIKTFTDYIDYTEQSKIIEKIPLYDLKSNREIKYKNKYFFLDNWILNSINHFRQTKERLIKNLVFIKLYYYKFEIFGGRFWTYEFDFYIKENNCGTYAIKVSNQENFKRDLARLKKVGATKKYIILENLEDLKIKKKVYDNLEIISLEDFIKKDLD